MCIFRYYCKNRSLKWKIIISSIVLIMCVLVFMPTVSSVDSEYKFTVSIKSNELDNDDIEIIPIEASSHYEYGQMAVETEKEMFSVLLAYSILRSIEYNAQYDSLNENITAWQGDNNFTDFIAEFQGIRDALGLKNLKKFFTWDVC